MELVGSRTRKLLAEVYPDQARRCRSVRNRWSRTSGVINHIEFAQLVELARRPFPDGTYRDDAGDVRLITPVMD